MEGAPTPNKVAGSTLRSDGVHQLSQWFIGIFGLTYLTGYLIEFFYYASWGIVEAAGEVFKLKYIQSGITFFFFAGTVIIYILAWIEIDRINFPLRRAVHQGWYITRTLLGVGIFNIMSIFFAALFTSLHYTPTITTWGPILLLIFSILLYAIIIHISERRYSRLYSVLGRRRSPRTSRALRKELLTEWRNDLDRRDKVALALWAPYIAILDLILIRAKIPWLLDLALGGGWIFAILLILTAVLLYRLLYRYNQLKTMQDVNSGFRRGMLMTLSTVVMSIIFFLLIICYSYWVFPFIPSVKGGGDYEHALRVVFVLKQPAKKEQLDANLDYRDLQDNINRPTDAILLYTTTTSYYFARPIKGSDPCDWRAGRSRPRILQVKREEIRALSVPGYSAEQPQSNCVW